MADNHLEGNAGVVESPLLMISSNWSSTEGTVEERPVLELTSVTKDVARRKFRGALMKLRCILAFTLAGGGGDHYVDDKKVQNEFLDELLDRSTTASHTVVDVPAEEKDWPSNLVRSQSMEQFHQVTVDVERLASAVETDTANGINDDDQQSIASRRQRYGSNRIEASDNNNKLQIVWETIKDPIIVFLLLCALLSLGFGVIKHRSKGWTDGGGIFVAVFVVVAVTAYCKSWPRKQIFSKLGQSHCEMFMSEHGHDANQKTPLEGKLHKLAMHIAKVGFVVAFLVLLIHLIRYFTGNMQGEDLGKHEFLLTGKSSNILHVFFAVIGILVTPITIASTAIPEGLLLAVIVPLAYSRYRMAAEDKAFLSRLAALEEIGSTTVICTSQNLQVTRFLYDQEVQDTFSSIAPNVRKLLLQGVHSDPGSSTESFELAIRKWANEGNIEQVTPNATVLLHQRGDPEAMLADSYQYYDRHGNIKKITNEVREILKQSILEMKSNFPQYIGFSCSDKSGDDQEEGCFTLIGVAGLTYPCLPEMKDVVNDCQSATVDVKLVTGSELPAAIAIARECGILRSNEEPATGLVIEGHDFQNYPEEERLRISNEIRVLAGASAMDKRCLVQDLKRIGHVVAVTGDSVGDADVLKEANVGLSLGIQGTNIAKETSDVIILNDNFESIATAIRWGRSMYCKIQTFVQFQLIVSISSLTVDFVTAISARELPNINAVATISAGKTPFAALQVLWAKLIVGVLACLAITIEEPAKKLKELPSVKKTEPFMTNIMWKNIVGQALYPVIVLLTINFKGESVLKVDPKVKDTMIFNTFVLWQLVSIFKTKRFNGINVIKWIQREKLFWTILISMGCLQVVIVEALERFAGTKRLNWMEWAECIGLAVLAWPIGWLVQRFISLVP